MNYKRNKSDIFVDTLNYLILTAFALITLLPFLYVIAVSFSPYEQVIKGGLILWPDRFNFDSYKVILGSRAFINSMRLTVFVTVFGTILNIVVTCLMAYPLSRKYFSGRNAILFLVLFTMLFNGGMIPTYLVVKATGLLNSVWALIVPGLVSAFNLIILKNFFQSIPDELEEAARIDGCTNIMILFKIFIPLSLPALATFTLFYSVGHWNSFFTAVLYNNKQQLWPIQVLIRQMVLQSGLAGALDSAINETEVVPITIKMAGIVIATIPILIVYPYLQKHFAKGVLLGSVKG